MKRFFSEYDSRYMRIAMPASFESLCMILLASADLIMVGSLGPEAVAAVSIFIQPRLVVFCFSRSIASAITLMTSRLAGLGDRVGAANLLRQFFFMSLLFLGVLHALFFLELEPILRFMGAEEDYIGLAMEYGNIAAIAVFISSMTYILQAVQLGFAQTSVIMKTNIAGNVVNIVCNAVLIFGLGPFPEMGVAGAAIGTVIGTLVTLFYTMAALQRDGFFVGTGRLLPRMSFWREFLPIFFSVFSEQGFERAGMVIFSMMAAGLGTVPFAVHSICMNICDIYYDFALGLSKASMVLAGQSCGRRSMWSWRLYRNSGIKWSLIFSTASFVLTFLFRDQIFGIYTSDPASLAVGHVIMILVALVSYPEAHALVCAGILRGSGKTAAVAVYSFVIITILRPLMTAFFIYQLDMGIYGAWLALILDQSCRAGCSTWLLSKIKRVS